MDLIKKVFKGDKIIWIIFAILCVISIIEVFSAASTLTYKSGDHWSPISQHVSHLVAGVLIMIFIQNLNYNWFKLFPFLLGPISCFLLLIITVMGYVYGSRTNGAARWAEIAGIQFQPSELAKIAIVSTVAYILSRHQGERFADNKAYKYTMYSTLPFCFLIGIENFSTAALLLVVIFSMLFIGRVRIFTLFKSGLAVAVVGLALFGSTKLMPDNPVFHRAGTWVNRITAHFVKKEDKVPPAQFDMDKNGQRGHANIAIATSSLVGVGPGNSVQRDFLSQAFSDFIFAIILEELGLIGGGFVALLYVWLLIRIGKVAKKCNSPFAIFLVFGIGILLVSQAMMNMLVAVGVLPVTGQPLPLVSKGGTSTLVNCGLLGMILSVSHATDQRIAATTEKEKAEKLAQEQEELPSQITKKEVGFSDTDQFE